MTPYLVALRAVTFREAMRFVNQRSRFLAALVRPLIWLVVFAAGFRAALGLSIIPPYQTYITYEVYIVPGLCGMIQLFNGMQSSLGLVYDQETGSMRLLLTSRLPRGWLLFCKLLAGVAVLCFRSMFSSPSRRWQASPCQPGVMSPRSLRLSSAG